MQRPPPRPRASAQRVPPSASAQRAPVAPITNRPAPTDEPMTDLRRGGSTQPKAAPAPVAAPAPAPAMAPGLPMAIPMGISGPVAYAPMAQAPVAPAADDAARASSYRVFAVVSGLMMMVMTAAVVSVLAIALGVAMQQPPKGQPPTAVYTPAPPRGGGVDTGGAPAPPPPPPPDDRRREPRPPVDGGGTRTPPPPPEPKAVEVGTVTLNITGGGPYNLAELKCDGGARERAPITNGVATIGGVPGPGKDRCRVVFKGGGGLPSATVEGGKSYTCSFQGNIAVCK